MIFIYSYWIVLYKYWYLYRDHYVFFTTININYRSRSRDILCDKIQITPTNILLPLIMTLTAQKVHPMWGKIFYLKYFSIVSPHQIIITTTASCRARVIKWIFYFIKSSHEVKYLLCLSHISIHYRCVSTFLWM